MLLAMDYEPLHEGPFGVVQQTIEARDPARDRTFPCEVWSPAGDDESRPLILFSHASGQGRNSATFLCHHLASHGYRVAAPDHSEMVVPELRRPERESEE